MLDTTECYEENRKGEYTFLVLYCIYRKKKKIHGGLRPFKLIVVQGSTVGLNVMKFCSDIFFVVVNLFGNVSDLTVILSGCDFLWKKLFLFFEE